MSENPTSDQRRHIVAWIAPATWPAVVDDLRGRPDTDRLTLVAAADTAGSLPPPGAGLFGRGHRRGPHPESEVLIGDAAQRLVEQAASALGRSAAKRVITGRTERVIVEAARDADVLVVARDGDRGRLGPPSLGNHTRFVIDHAPCAVLLLWPERAPDVSTIPPPPPHER